ncbi:mitotic spindle assembly checkpoint protein mad2 [Holotrichia oblita]|uniref:Mitotic spindle assembly checkpoint protein mad2 n=2 Tax=Holotrichia oblita TaxID=644536 RepID=A0ACB9TF39_HOLOL|nr:mitotic spindle assembly checkpoint protein mad2 [Holotrichia oblita]KAI4465418.1 mitotic spindle assembly checkpoint protein mad2 [Holotrichia oblita]
MTAVEQKNKSAITLKGSSDIICEYLDYGINSILYQRGLYPPETFKTAENYGLTILMSQDNKIQEFLSTTLNQLKGKDLIYNHNSDQFNFSKLNISKKQAAQIMTQKEAICGQWQSDDNLDTK